MFIIWNFRSRHYKQCFRTIELLTSTYSTVFNFSLDLVFNNAIFFNKTSRPKDIIIKNKNEIIEEENNVELLQRNSISWMIDYSYILKDFISINKILNCGNKLNLQELSEKIKM